MKYLSRAYFVLAVITSQTVASNIIDDRYDQELKNSVAFLRHIKLQAMVDAHDQKDGDCKHCLSTSAPEQDQQSLGNPLLTTQPYKKSKIFSLKKTLRQLCHFHQ